MSGSMTPTEIREWGETKIALRVLGPSLNPRTSFQCPSCKARKAEAAASKKKKVREEASQMLIGDLVGPLPIRFVHSRLLFPLEPCGVCGHPTSFAAG